jgi:hypothetical protein
MPPALFAFSFSNRVSQFCPNWPWTMILLPLYPKKLGLKVCTTIPSLLFCFRVFFLVLGFELRAYTLSHSTWPFLWWVFFWPDWPQVTVLLITASWVARITVLSHWRPAIVFVLRLGLRCRSRAKLGKLFLKGTVSRNFRLWRTRSHYPKFSTLFAQK